MPKVALEAVDKFVARVKFACQMLVLFVRLSALWMRIVMVVLFTKHEKRRT